MNTDYEKIKADLLAFGKKNGACVEQYQRLYKAESIEEVIAIVKENFWWCAKYRDFADVIVANREQFAEHQIWVNQDVEIREGVEYLLATDGEIYVTSCGTSTINATSYGASTIIATSAESSTINVGSYDTSIIKVSSCDYSTINAKSCGYSTIYATSWDSSTINASSYDTSTIAAESLETSTITAAGCDYSTINTKSWDISTIKVKSWDSSNINASSYDTSTMIIFTTTISCDVNNRSIARYVYENRIVVADDSIKVEKAGE